MATYVKKFLQELLVDDESDIGTLVQKGLANEGFKVDVSGDPVEVAGCYKAGEYDLVLLDIRMPQMSVFVQKNSCSIQERESVFCHSF
jgi:DNA-binding response OmpR family regulator